MQQDTDYALLHRQLLALIESEQDFIANTANMAALLYHGIEDLNWAGFYFLRGDELVLGPFQGQPACVRIPLTRGVCGAAASRRQVLRVDDVHAFPGHIACDSASRSELVIPLLQNDQLVGVLDLDSPSSNRFSVADQTALEGLCRLLLDHCRFEVS